MTTEIIGDGNETIIETIEEIVELITEGIQGPVGIQGEKGEQGEQGEKGEKGDQGEVDLNNIPTKSVMIAADTAVLASANAHADTAATAALTTALAATSLAQSLAETNEFKISQLQDGLDATNETAADNFSALSTLKADKSDLDTLQALVDTKATQADITAAIAELVGTAPDALNTIYELAAQLQGEAATIALIMAALNNCVRFDAAQSLTTPQKNQARSNIEAEKAGTAAGLVAAVTPSSIGAATAAQGAKANSALQSGDVAPVALSGSFSDLINKSSLFNLAYSAYVIGSNTVLLATDTLGQMLGKLQAQVNAKEPTISLGTVSQYWSGDKSWRDFAADVRAVTLTGLSTATATAITAADTTLSALGKLQAQVSANKSNTSDFDMSTWSFNDFDNSSSAGGVGVVAISTGTASYGSITNLYGSVRITSSTTVNSGMYVAPNQAIYATSGLICRKTFILESSQTTRLIHIGYCASGVYAATESNGAYIEISDRTAVAWTAKAGVTTSQGSATLPLNVLLSCDIEWITATSVRLVLFESVSKVKLIDETISTNTPTAAIFPMIKATSSGTTAIPLCVIDYFGRGRSRPTYIITPP